MKKRLETAWLTALVSDTLPDSVMRLRKRTPWYRPSRLRTVPWLAVAFIAPLAIFLLWKGVELLLPKGESTGPSGNQPPSTELT